MASLVRQPLALSSFHGHPPNRTLPNIPRGDRGEQSAPLCHGQHHPPGSGRNPPSRKRTRGKACGKTDPPARLTRRKEGGRTATTTSGRAGGGTHGVRTYALTVVNARGFPIRGTVARHPAG